MLSVFVVLALSTLQEPRADEAPPRATAAESDASAVPDDAAAGELEQMRAVEKATIDPRAQAGAVVRNLAGQLGAFSATHDRLAQAIDSMDLSGEEENFVLPIVDNVEQFDVSLVRDKYDIPIEMRPLVAQYIRFFQGAGRKWFRRWMARSTRYIPLMQPLLETLGMPRDTVYLAMIESGFSSQAKSFAQAVGPWQFISSTGKLFGLKEDFWIDERRDPVKATRAAAAYLTVLKRDLGNWYLAWAGYNTGGGRVRRAMQAHGAKDFWELSETKKIFKETKHYVPKLIAAALVAKNPQAFGFDPSEFDYQSAFTFEEVKLPQAVEMELLAQAAGVPIEVLQELNPEIKRWCTPPATPDAPYIFRVPEGDADKVTARLEQLEPAERLHFATVVVRKGDTLSKIAARNNSAGEAIIRLNQLPSAKMLKLGSQLIVPIPEAGKLASAKDPQIERQVVLARRDRLFAPRPQDEVPAGTVFARRRAAGGSIVLSKVGEKTMVTYGVAQGDSLWSIAKRFSVPVGDIKAWNPARASAKHLLAGAALTLWPPAAVVATLTDSPSPPQASVARASSKSKAGPKDAAQSAGKTAHLYKVARGDNLWVIARRHGVTTSDIRDWNNLQSSKIVAGQSLVVRR